MAFKQYFPVVVIFVIAGAILTAFMLVGENTERKIQDASLDYARTTLKSKGEVEGRDFSIGTIEILSRTDTEAVVAVEVKPRGSLLFLQLVGDNGWKVKQDIAESFSAYMSGPELERQVIERLLKKLGESEHVGIEATIKPGAQTKIQIKRQEKDVVALIEMPFRVPTGEGQFNYGHYVEGFTYSKGTWVSQGDGQLLQYVPRNPPRKQ